MDDYNNTIMQPDMPSLHDQEGSTVPVGLPPIVDAHVHVFPRAIFAAVWKWFDDHAWPIRYQMASSRIIDFLLSRGVKHIVALQYAHKPGMARQLNTYMANLCNGREKQITGMATVFPGEDGGAVILQEAFDAGLGGVKLHAHVQCFDMNANYMDQIYECCRSNAKPLLMHVGREPKSLAYACDPHQLCQADKLESVLKDFPGLKICVPHLGYDEIRAYRKLTEKYDNLWLDTAMLLTDYFPLKQPIDLKQYRIDRVMYGSDFPTLPYAWDRELNVLHASDIPYDVLEKILCMNAVDFYNADIKTSPHQSGTAVCQG